MHYGGLRPVAPPLSVPPFFNQGRRSAFSLHSAVDPAEVAPFMPRGVRPDVCEGATFAELVPFRTLGAGPRRRLMAPYLETLLE